MSWPWANLLSSVPGILIVLILVTILMAEPKQWPTSTLLLLSCMIYKHSIVGEQHAWPALSKNEFGIHYSTIAESAL